MAQELHSFFLYYDENPLSGIACKIPLLGSIHPNINLHRNLISQNKNKKILK